MSSVYENFIIVVHDTELFGFEKDVCCTTKSIVVHDTYLFISSTKLKIWCSVLQITHNSGV